MRTRRRGKFVKYGKLPLPIMADTSISAASKILYGYLDSRCFNDDHPDECYPSQNTVAENLGTDVRTMRRWLKELIDRGLIEVVKKDRSYSNIYVLEDVNEVYGDIATATWNEMPKQRPKPRTKQSDIERAELPSRAELPEPSRAELPDPFYLLNKKKKEEEEGSSSSSSVYQETPKTDPIAVKNKEELDAKMLFASVGKRDKPKPVNKKQTSKPSFAVNEDIKNCHQVYSEFMRANGVGSGALTPKKAAVWQTFLEGQNKPSDGIKIIQHVMNHWDALKRKYSLKDTLPGVFFFNTGYIDSIAIEVLAKSNSNRLNAGKADYGKMAEMVKARQEAWLKEKGGK